MDIPLFLDTDKFWKHFGWSNKSHSGTEFKGGVATAPSPAPPAAVAQAVTGPGGVTAAPDAEPTRATVRAAALSKEPVKNPWWSLGPSHHPLQGSSQSSEPVSPQVSGKLLPSRHNPEYEGQSACSGPATGGLKSLAFSPWRASTPHRQAGIETEEVKLHLLSRLWSSLWVVCGCF